MPVITDAEKIQLLLETLGIEGINAGTLAYDALEKKMKDVEKEQGPLKQQTLEFTEVLKLQSEKEINLADLMQEQARRMRERAAAQDAVRRAIEESIVPTEQSAIAFDKVGRGMFDVERGVNALASGQGLVRLGPLFERILGYIGGPAGMGFALAGVAFALEQLIPKFTHWLNEANIKHAEELAKAMERQADAADRLAQRLPKKEQERKADIEEFITESGKAGDIRRGIEAAIRKDPNARLTPEEIESLKHGDVGGEFGTGGRVARRNAAIREEQEKRITAETNRIFGGIGDDKQARLRAIDLAETHPEMFPPGFADALRQAQMGNKIGPTHVAAQLAKDMAAERSARHEIRTAQDKEAARLKHDATEKQRIAHERQHAWTHAVNTTSDMIDHMEKGWAADKEKDNELVRRTAAEAQREENAEINRKRREAEHAARQAPHLLKQAQEHQAEVYVGNVAANMGENLTHVQTVEAAKHALDAYQHGLNAQDAAIGAISAVLNKSHQMEATAIRQAEMWEAIRQQAQGMQPFVPTPMGRGK